MTGEIALVVLSVLCVLNAIYLERARGFWTSSEPIFVSLLLAAALLFPLAAAPFIVVYGFVAHRLLAAANAHKIDLTNNPVMPIDLRTAIKDPRLICDITETPHWVGWVVAFAVVLASSALLAGIAVSVFHSDIRLTGVRSVLLVALALYSASATGRFGAELAAWIRGNQSPFGKDTLDRALVASWTAPVSMWTPSFNAALSKHIGMVSFLLFKLLRNTRFEARIHRKSKISPPLPPTYVTSSIPNREPVELPNIVVMQLESVCNPNWAFELKSEFSSFLFRANKLTQFVTPLRVNTLGGGSWVTEFEFLTGLDVRLFGDDGLYTHVTLPRFIREAFPGYLKRNGYRTYAFYSAMGAFYNASSAYERYGFGRFWDMEELKIGQWASSDIMMADAFGEKLHAISKTPFFAYIVTNGAHSPFRRVKKNEYREKASFSLSAEPSLVKKLEDYLALLRESEEAVRSVLDRLIAVENSTGRPFVLLVYGDHQPSDFIRNAGFDKFRSAQPMNQTFAHLMSSKGRIDINSEIPATLLPSVLSSLTAPLTIGGSDGLYLPINFYLFRRTGPDMFGKPFHNADPGVFQQAFGPLRPGTGPASQSVPLTPERASVHQAMVAQNAAIHWLQNSTVLRGI